MKYKKILEELVKEKTLIDILKHEMEPLRVKIY